MTHSRTARVRAGVIVGAAALVLTGCSSNAGAQGGGDAVAAGATKADYAEALADMEPVTLRLQSAVPEGQGTSVGFAAYADAVEEWSDGKIKIESFYSASIAPPGEEVDAFNDGRIDLGIVVSGASPELFKVTPTWVDANGAPNPDANRSWLAMQLSTLERGYASEDFQAEYEAQGIHVLLPYLLSDDTGLLCVEPFTSLEDLKGRQVRVGSPSQIPQTEALGMTSVSLAFTELFEGLQRGVVDCVFTPLGFAKSVGLLELANNWIGSQQNTGGVVGSPFGFSLDQWTSLPLAARQLLHDRLDVYIEETLATSMKEAAAAFKVLDEQGGGIQDVDQQVLDALNNVATDKVEKVRGNEAVDGEEMVAVAEETRSKWLTTLAEDGYPEVAWGDELVTWLAENPAPDFSAAIDRFRIEVLDANRPE